MHKGECSYICDDDNPLHDDDWVLVNWRWGWNRQGLYRNGKFFRQGPAAEHVAGALKSLGATVKSRSTKRNWRGPGGPGTSSWFPKKLSELDLIKIGERHAAQKATA